MAKIMIVDDETVIATQLEEVVESFGHRVVGIASNSLEAISMAAREKPDLILMDIVMPGELDGIGAAARIREQMDIPVIFLTAYADNDLIAKAKVVEPAGYILKPFKEAEIKAMIEITIHKLEIDNHREASIETSSTVIRPEMAVITVDNQRNIRIWSIEAEKLFGFRSEEVVSKPLTQIFSRQFHDKLDHELNCLHISDRPYKIGGISEYMALRQDKAKFPVEVSLALWKTPREVYYTCIISDCTEKKETLDRLSSSQQEREQRFQDIHHQYSSNIQGVT